MKFLKRKVPHTPYACSTRGVRRVSLLVEEVGHLEQVLGLAVVTDDVVTRTRHGAELLVVKDQEIPLLVVDDGHRHGGNRTRQRLVTALGDGANDDAGILLDVLTAGVADDHAELRRGSRPDAMALRTTFDAVEPEELLDVGDLDIVDTDTRPYS